jgi:hypothetical protein
MSPPLKCFCGNADPHRFETVSGGHFVQDSVRVGFRLFVALEGHRCLECDRVFMLRRAAQK